MSSSKDKQTKSTLRRVSEALVIATAATATIAAATASSDHAKCTNRPFGPGATTVSSDNINCNKRHFGSGAKDFSWMSESSSDD
ncbi:Hypothetical protein EHI5A_186140 [Entamoeba histolytica KU27]|uniref:Uncharacterized protein n=1 Tax=Entamoeba histolytica KU27 TaxID=885311 RepID=M2SBT9_ENTHI|nr:Hypothetical protein EHI5A_186140 [Entamoeba histolytica KU27]